MPERRATRTRFFPPGRPGLAVFLNAGDPGLHRLPELVDMLDRHRVDCLELAVPFPDSPTDGPVIRRSAGRALATGVDCAAVLDAVRALPARRHLRIALLADWAHTIRGERLPDFLDRISQSAVDGLLVHGLPPLLRTEYHETARDLDLPIVTTCYPRSAPDVLADAARNASAYLYLVAHYRRSGTPADTGYQHLATTVDRLRGLGDAPIAVGFGIRDRDDVAAVTASGADAAIVGSAAVARIEAALDHGRDPVAELSAFVGRLRNT